MSNKEIVLKFYEEVFNAWDLSKVDDYMREDYIQHNPTVENGREGFKKFAAGFFTQEPRMEIIKAAEDGDMVFIFFKCSFKNGSVAKVCDIYRLQDGKLAEHWDVLQGGCENVQSVNGNDIF